MKTSANRTDIALNQRLKLHFRRIVNAAALAMFITVLSCAAPSRLNAQQSGRFEVGADYNYLRSNAPPGGCGCFGMNGGDGWAGWGLTDGFALVSQVGVQRASGINGTSASLTLYSFLGGPRIKLRQTHLVQPFGQVLFGGAHASGLLTPLPSGAAGSANVFALSAGGGVDLGFGNRISIRAVEVDYLLTNFANGVNQRQNNLRVIAGVFFRFGSAR
jgi:outer membrane immunogenic protein